MSEDEDLDRFVKDVKASKDLPKWISPFRRKYYKEGRLPFLIVYQACGIARNSNGSVFENKGASIAIATKNLQKKKYIGEGTNTLTVTGEYRELALMKRLGKRVAEDYIRYFDLL